MEKMNLEDKILNITLGVGFLLSLFSIFFLGILELIKLFN